MRIKPRLGSLHVLFLSFFALFLIQTLPLGSQERFRRSPPLPEPVPELSLPLVETHTLTNGLGIAIVRKQDQPVISMRLIIMAGESVSPDHLPGIATLCARMITKGSMNLRAEEIEEKIESIGGNISVETHPDYTEFIFSFLEEYLEDAMRLLGETLLRPTFPRLEIGNIQRSMFYDLAIQNNNPEFIARRLLYQVLFESHPYRKITFDQGGIKNLSRKDIVSFYSRYYRPNNAKLVLIGNLSLEIASRTASRYLSPWEKREVEPPSVPLLNPRDKMKVCFVDLPHAKDTTIYLGNIIFPITSQDYFPFTVFNQVIGGTPNSRLFMHLRESKAYAYYAFSEMWFFRSCGIFLIRAKVLTEFSYDAIQGILQEINNLRYVPIPSQEIEQAKSYLIGNFPLKMETYDDLSGKLSEIQAFGLGRDHWERYYSNIIHINSGAVSQMGQKYSLHTPVIVIVGNKEIMEYLKEFALVGVYTPDGTLRYEIKKGEK
ncbi:MAG: insulinase family protein [Candidatus Aminicenantes bacterium]|nr:MAG: insulinase family protein [Candidatus Aminicenantes bacterium]